MKSTSRTLINIIGVPLILGSIYLGSYLFTALIASITILGTIEYNKLLKKSSANPSHLLIVAQIILVLTSFYITYTQTLEYPYKWNYVLWVWLCCFYLALFTISCMIIEVFRKSTTSILNISSSVFGFVWIGIFINCLIWFRYLVGPENTLIVFISLWICDTFAFFFGKNFGKTKILPEVSPNKTIVGSFSGLLGSVIFLLIIYSDNAWSWSYLFDIIILGIITGGVSQFGDFFESKLKREVGVKDTSNLLMGHGGILDRFDSLLIISPLLLVLAIIDTFNRLHITWL